MADLIEALKLVAEYALSPANPARSVSVADWCVNRAATTEMSRVAVWPCETARILDGEAVDRG